MQNTKQNQTGERTRNGTIAREFIQCVDETGKVGSFLATNSNRQVSPTFSGLVELYEWTRLNGWKAECGAYIKH